MRVPRHPVQEKRPRKPVRYRHHLPLSMRLQVQVMGLATLGVWLVLRLWPLWLAAGLVALSLVVGT